MSSCQIETIVTEPLEYQGASSTELGYGAELVRRHFAEYEATNGQRIGVYATQPLDSNGQHRETVIMPASHDYRIEPLWMMRADIIASATQKRVVLVDTPGTVGLLEPQGEGRWEVYTDTKRLTGDQQTLVQATHALAGIFRPHVATQLDAIEHTVGLPKDEHLSLLGESMGAPVVVDMLAEVRSRGLQVEAVTLYEAVNLFHGHSLGVPARLARVLRGIENDRRNHYFLENELIGHPITAFELVSEEQKKLDDARKSLGQQAAASLINGIGMARGLNGRLMNILRDIPLTQRPEIKLIRGQDSLASKADDYLSFADELRGKGMAPRVFEVADAQADYPIGHSHTVSLARQRQIADFLFK
jgi:hypothetical protein